MTNWDYSSPGFYFITICTLNMNKFFGKITSGEMELSKIGKIASTELSTTIQIRKYTINIPVWVIMPNHLHLIIEIKHVSRDVARYVSTNTTHVSTNNFTNKNPMSVISPKSNSIASIIRSYKSAVKSQCNRIPVFFAWQSRFYDHLIRSLSPTPLTGPKTNITFYHITKFTIFSPRHYHS